MWGGGRVWVRSDVTSGRNRRWEWRLDAGYGEAGKRTSEASGHAARASDAGLIFADAANSIHAGVIAFCHCHHLVPGIFWSELGLNMAG